MFSSTALHDKPLPYRRESETTDSEPDNTAHVTPRSELRESFQAVKKMQENLLKEGRQTIELQNTMIELLKTGLRNVCGSNEYQDLKRRLHKSQTKYEAIDAEYEPKYQALKAATEGRLKAVRLERNAEHVEQVEVAETQNHVMEADLERLMDQIEALRIDKAEEQ